MVVVTLLSPYLLITVHVMSIASCNNTGDMESAPDSDTENLPENKGAPSCEVQEKSPGGKLRGARQVSVALVFVEKTVGWMEIATGEPVCKKEGVMYYYDIMP